MGYVRARNPVIVRNPEIDGALEVLNPAVPVKDNDPFVKAYPWAFASDDELATERGVEDTQPQRKRQRRRGAGSAVNEDDAAEESQSEPVEHGPITTEDNPAK